MNFKILLLFIVNFVELYCSLNFSSFKDQTTLSIGIKLISEKIVPEFAITFNSISTSDDHLSNDFRDTFIKILMSGLKLKFRQQSIEKIGKFSLTVPRRFSFIAIRNFSDFKKFYKELNPVNFFHNVHFILALINGKIEEIQNFFDDLWKLQVHNVIVIYEDSHEHLSIVTFFPFQSSTDCSNTTPVLINEFINGSFTRDLSYIFPKKMENLQQCEVKVATSNNIAPHISAKTMPDGLSKFSGRDFDLIKTLSKCLNFKLNFTFVSYFGCLNTLDGEEGSLQNVFLNKSDLAIADCWLRLSRLNTLDSTTTYFSDKSVMAFPMLAELSSFEKLFYPLAMVTWILLMSYLLIGILSIFIIKRLSKTIQNFIFGRKIKHPYLNMFIGLLGTTQHKLPGTNFARFLLMNFLILSLIIRTAYQGKLYQIMQANIKNPEPQTLREMEKQGYKFHAVEAFSELAGESNKVKFM